MMKALSFRQIDEEEYAHKIAYESFRATSTKSAGKNTYPVYKTFKSFYNTEERIKQLEAQYDKAEGITDDPYAALKEFKRKQAQAQKRQ
jgi:hypothetical protein